MIQPGHTLPGIHTPRRRCATLLLAAVVATAGCGSDDPAGVNDNDGPGGPGGPVSQVSARFNGEDWTATEVTSTFMQDRRSFVGDGGEWRIVVQVRGFTGTGSYPLSAEEPLVTIMVLLIDTGVWGGVSATGTGVVNVTSSTPDRVVGTFSGVLPRSPGSHTDIDTMHVVNGAFDIVRESLN